MDLRGKVRQRKRLWALLLGLGYGVLGIGVLVRWFVNHTGGEVALSFLDAWTWGSYPFLLPCLGVLGALACASGRRWGVWVITCLTLQPAAGAVGLTFTLIDPVTRHGFHSRSAILVLPIYVSIYVWALIHVLCIVSADPPASADNHSEEVQTSHA